MNQDLLLLLNSLKGQRIKIAQSLLGLIVVKVATISIPILIGSGIDVIASYPNQGDESVSQPLLHSWLTSFSQDSSMNPIFLVSLLLTILSLLLVVLAPWQQKIQTELIQKTVFDLTMDWIDRVFKKDLRFFKEKNAARTANILGRGIHGHEKLISQLINVLLPVLIEALLASIVLVKIGGATALAFVSFSVVMQTLLTLWLIRYRRPLISELNDIEDESAEMTQDLLSKGLIFQVYRATGNALEKLAVIYRNYADQCMKISVSGAHLSWLPFQFQTLGSVVALVLGFYLVQNQSRSLGEVMILISFFSRFSSAASECVGSFRVLDQFKLDVQDAKKLLTFQEFYRNGDKIHALESVTLKRGVLFRDGVVLHIPEEIELVRGDRVALVGASGSGKSTLLEVFAGLDEESRDAIHWNGVQLSNIGSDEHLRLLRYTPQDPMVFKGTFTENIFQEYPIEESVLRALDLQHIQNECRKEISFKSLSGGEAKRVSLVRVLSSWCDLYLMDEPTAGLNEDLRQRTWDLIQKKTKDGILIAITHDEDQLNRFNKILTVKGGIVTVRSPDLEKQLNSDSRQALA